MLDGHLERVFSLRPNVYDSSWLSEDRETAPRNVRFQVQ